MDSEAPEVLHALWVNVHPMFIATVAEHEDVQTLEDLRAAGADGLSDALVAWARSFNLDVPWVYVHALWTLRSWPRERDQRPEGWARPPIFGRVRRGGAVRIRSADHLRWLAMYQARRMTLAAIVREERRRFDERPTADAALDEVKAKGRELPPTHVRRVIDAHEKSRSGRSHLDSQTVDEAVRRLARRIGLPLRRARRGRPGRGIR